MPKSKFENLENLHRLWRRQHRAANLSHVYVGGEGERDSPIAILIGEAPGAHEETQKRPFVGSAGIVLRELMGMTGLYPLAWKTGAVGPEYQAPTIDPAGGYAPNCWLTNVVKFRPPRNRTPVPQEIMSVRMLLRQEWHAVNCPQVIIPVGGVALHAIYGRRISILATAGKCHKQNSVTVPELKLFIWPMVHPSYGLRSGNTHIQELLERDWQKLGEWLKSFTTQEIYHSSGNANGARDRSASSARKGNIRRSV